MFKHINCWMNTRIPHGVVWLLLKTQIRKRGMLKVIKTCYFSLHCMASPFFKVDDLSRIEVCIFNKKNYKMSGSFCTMSMTYTMTGILHYPLIFPSIEVKLEPKAILTSSFVDLGLRTLY